MKKKEVLVIGAGFSGLAAACHLQESGFANVTIFDGNQSFEKASMIASGIIHPFPGQNAKIAKFYQEAITEAFLLFEKAEKHAQIKCIDHQPIYRIATNPDQTQIFQQLVTQFSFVKPFHLENPLLKKENHGVLIELSKTIFSQRYLESLENFFLHLGGKIERRQVDSLETVENFFDHIVVAAGKNTARLLNLSGIKFHKGQLLVGHFKNGSNLNMSVTGKGYLALTDKIGYYSLGSTYEHHFSIDGPTQDAKDKILKDGKQYLNLDDFQVDQINCGYRVTKKINGIPLVLVINSKYSTITAMGSRGLLYHALCAKYLKEALFEDKDIPSELKIY